MRDFLTSLHSAIVASGTVIDGIDANGKVTPANLQAAAQPTIDAFIASWPATQAAEATDLAAYESDKAAFNAGLSAAVTRLTAIKDNASPSNAQVIAAVRDLAAYQLQTIKALRRML